MKLEAVHKNLIGHNIAGTNYKPIFTQGYLYKAIDDSNKLFAYVVIREDKDYSRWVASEYYTGMRITKGNTKMGTVKATTKILQDFTTKKFAKLIEEKLNFVKEHIGSDINPNVIGWLDEKSRNKKL